MVDGGPGTASKAHLIVMYFCDEFFLFFATDEKYRRTPPLAQISTN
jgi:hypothetical protein